MLSVMTIHSTHPFADPEPDDVRRFRGRLGGAVTLWTAGSDERRAGLTVSSLMVAHGEAPRILALVDPDSDFLEVLGETRRAVVHVLAWPDRSLAEVFAGTAPAPGGMFRQAAFETTEWGPRLASTSTYAHVVPVAEESVGWSTLLTCALDSAQVGVEDGPMLGHRRGRFFPLGSGV
jgi:flavin reductase (DIM6/NTAB) family NADH-FMN oxidoreductase RutF